MSRAKEANEVKKSFLQHVKLKNYKSIRNIDVDFKPGLNIIIGKNGSGKTNLLSSLNNILNFNYHDQPDTESTITARIGWDKFFVESKILEDGEIFKDRQPIQTHLVEIKINDREKERFNFNHLGEDFKTRTMLSSNSTTINFGAFYVNTPFINNPLSFQLINNSRISSSILMDDIRTLFLEDFFVQLYNLISREYKATRNINLFAKSIKREILEFSTDIFSNLNTTLNDFSPIEKIRLNSDFKIIEEEEKQRVSISNFYVEFKIGDDWLPFDFLSDGTKRLFYIISEFIELEDRKTYFDRQVLSLRLLEEPELGIHPHQLHKLMLFIKEQSREKQIILTTHSPQVLDILSSNELDRIIICDYDKEKGTQLHHLNDAQLKKAKLYMKNEGFLSDYWRFSDLEPA